MRQGAYYLNPAPSGAGFAARLAMLKSPIFPAVAVVATVKIADSQDQEFCWYGLPAACITIAGADTPSGVIKQGVGVTQNPWHQE
ncbi:hypothetical protein ABHF33_00970 [Chitinibacter sp. FCG-7]|uniref:Uncharacterized protein n=1 Tax=Chitinibacter mangrovi TaxID=3153927 RepID=A0AAU7FAQ5_9NEIS